MGQRFHERGSRWKQESQAGRHRIPTPDIGTLEDGRDIVYWALEQSKKYSTGSLLLVGVRDRQMTNVWKCNIPLKVKIFIWMACHDRIQSGSNLRRNIGRVLKNVLLVMFWNQQIIYSVPNCRVPLDLFKGHIRMAKLTN